jgi:hypothetical protein
MKDLSLHILDIVQNSISARADLIEISIRQDIAANLYSLGIKDNGKGMDPETLLKVTDPFFTTRTTRKVGMGIPLLKLNAERAGGSFTIESEAEKGTRLLAKFGLNNIDRLPEGDLPGTIVMIAAANPDLDFIFSYAGSKGEYRFDTREIKEILGEIPINEVSVYPFLKEMISGNLDEIR